MAFPRRYSLLSLAIAITFAAILAAWFSPHGVKTPVQTGRELDLRILGEGMFVFCRDSDGERLYSRSGSLSRDSNGQLCLGRSEDECLLDPMITVPEGWTSVHVTPDGLVSARSSNDAAVVNIGHIQLARFLNPDSLVEVAPGLYEEGKSSGSASLCHPGDAGTGLLQQGWLERGRGWRIEPESVLVLVAIGLGAWTLLEVRRLHERLDKLEV